MCVPQKNHFGNWKYYSITARSKSNRQFVIQSVINYKQIVFKNCLSQVFIKNDFRLF